MYQEFNLEALKEMADGKVAAAFNRILRDAVKDAMDRPGEKAARTVSLQLSITPVIGQEGMCESVNVAAQISGKTPKYHSAPVNCTAKTTGQLLFNSMSEDHADQMTIDED